MIDAARYQKIGEAASVRDRVERAQHLLGGIIEDWSMSGEAFDNRERLEHTEAALSEALMRVKALRESLGADPGAS